MTPNEKMRSNELQNRNPDHSQTDNRLVRFVEYGYNPDARVSRHCTEGGGVRRRKKRE